MNLQTELERVREYGAGVNPPPTNEANTCDWIIRPLLLQCGYNYHDIHAQGHDAAGNIPDYTILPNTPHTWFLEAKKWQENITDTHVNQAANYVNTTAKRWFVVSNGREWRLYDNHIVQVPPSNRLVAAARFDCGTELEDLLTALSKSSAQSGELEKYALQTALNTTLQQELAAPTSDVVQAIVSALKSKNGLYAVTPHAVVAYFYALQTSSDISSVPPQSSPVPGSPLIQPTPGSASSPTNGLTLPELLAEGSATQGLKLVSLTYPNGSTKPVVTWRDVTLGVTEWLFAHGKAPQLPFRGQKGGQRCLINTTPFHLNGKDMTNKTLDINGQVIYVHVNRSSADFLRCLISLCKEVGEPPEGFRVKLQ